MTATAQAAMPRAAGADGPQATTIASAVDRQRQVAEEVRRRQDAPSNRLIIERRELRDSIAGLQDDLIARQATVAVAVSTIEDTYGEKVAACGARIRSLEEQIQAERKEIARLEDRAQNLCAAARADFEKEAEAIERLIAGRTRMLDEIDDRRPRATRKK